MKIIRFLQAARVVPGEFLFMQQLAPEKVRCSLKSTNSYSVLRVVVDVRHSLQQVRSHPATDEHGTVVILQEPTGFLGQRDSKVTAFVLEIQDESFNERDTPVLDNGAEARCDPLAITPILEHDAPGLLALVTRDIFRGSIGGMSDAFEELRNDQF